jgi:hypothetical protein
VISGFRFGVASRAGENGFLQPAKWLRGHLDDETTSQDRDRESGMLTGEIWTALPRLRGFQGRNQPVLKSVGTSRHFAALRNLIAFRA